VRGGARAPRSGGILALLGLRREDPVSRYSEAVASNSTLPPAPDTGLPTRYRGPSRSGPLGPEPANASVASTPVTPSAPRSASGGVGPECTNCRLPTLASNVPGQYSCPICGRRSGVAAVSTSPPVRPAAMATAAPHLSEELLAAWMSGTKLPCPSCKSPMRHAGPGEFVCRACGQRRTIAGFPAPLAPRAEPATPVPSA
jgi:uncharacterized Zn finger protein (UPF0148 family)